MNCKVLDSQPFLTTAITLVLVLFRSAQAAKTAPDPYKPENPLPCDCSDIDPRSYFTKADVQYSCLEQAQFGQCDMPFMSETQEEISEGYCQISCGRCGCCKSLADVLEERGFKSFLWLLRSTEAGSLIEQPGYMATLIAPYDSAMDDAISRLGFSTLDEALEKGKDKLEELARLHIIPPVPVTRAVYTHAFFTTGLKLPTALSYNEGKDVVHLDVRRTEDGKVELKAKNAGGWIYEEDIYACKGYVQAIGSALVP